MKIISVVGARPNFMKVAPIHRAFQKKEDIESIILHTGQHYDKKMSDIFFEQLGLPQPDIYLGIGGGSHAEQTGKVMMAFEKVVEQEKPDLILVVGDVNSTVACSMVGAKCHVPVAHVEAGLRSGDRRMPEEINRIVTDSLSELLFVTEQSGLDNLKAEGVADEKVHHVGNVMIDSLVHFRKKASSEILGKLSLQPKEYTLMTMHRPSNVDNKEGLEEMVSIIKGLAQYKAVVFPMHPRTRKNLEQFDLFDEVTRLDQVYITEPQGYFEFLSLMDNAALVVTDSGGIQEETTFLEVPCFTLRENTERPVTVDIGTNQLVEINAEVVSEKAAEVFSGKYKKGEIPPLWDGKAAERIASILQGYLSGTKNGQVDKEEVKTIA